MYVFKRSFSETKKFRNYIVRNTTLTKNTLVCFKFSFKDFPSAEKPSFWNIYYSAIDVSLNHELEMFRFVTCHYVENSFWTF